MFMATFWDKLNVTAAWLAAFGGMFSAYYALRAYKTSEQEFEIQTQAYLTVTPKGCTASKDELLVGVEVKNIGATPATNIEWSLSTPLQELPRLEPDLAKDQIQSAPFAIPLTQTIDHPEITGSLQFDDIFHHRHNQPWCLFYIRQLDTIENCTGNTLNREFDRRMEEVRKKLKLPPWAPKRECPVDRRK
jgi:hypothetical protein